MKFLISLAQIDVMAADPAANLSKAGKLTAEASRRGSEIICFPEMWTTGFCRNSNEPFIAAKQDHIGAVAALAAKHGIWITGSMLAYDEEGRASNTSILFTPNGKISAAYRKVHLFSLMKEEIYMAAGKALGIVETPWGRAGFAVCYDVRFPELFRTYALKGVKMVFCPAAFPSARLEHWKILLKARAIENQMFVIGINRIGGEDCGSEKVIYGGNSLIVDPWGRTVIEGNESEEMLLTTDIDLTLVDEARSRMSVFRDRRPDIYELE